MALLNPDQQAKFQKLVQRRDSALARTPRQ